MLSKNQQKRNQEKRERNNAKRKQRQANVHAEAVWRKSAKGRAVQAERAKEEAAAMTPILVDKIKLAAEKNGQTS
jgi:hypothetical protein